MGMQASPATAKVTITLKNSDGEALQMALPSGQNLMTALRDLQLLPGICGGNAACGTCRLTVDQTWIHQLQPMQRAEKRLISALAGGNSFDRLACQIKLESWMEGLVVQLPEKFF
jgi:CDP-4-dehydro-6-deoxyglucose reductase